MYLEVGNAFASLTHSNFIILQLLLFIHLSVMGEDVILFASRGTNVPLFYSGSKNKNPKHNFSICYFRKNLVYLNNFVMCTISSVCLSFCSLFFRVTSMEVARLSLPLKHTLSLLLVSFYFLLVNNNYSK